ncbi:hypothetical protein V8B97DRAFT_1975711 [Scleroderma yunnanense]
MGNNQSTKARNLYARASELAERYQTEGAMSDLDEAIKLFRKSLAMLSKDSRVRGHFLNAFGLCLSTRFKSQGALPDLDEAISHHREALELCVPGHPLRALSLDNLGLCLSTRFKSQGALIDLDEATVLHQEALGLLPLQHPDRFASLNNLGLCLSTRFMIQGTLADLERAIALRREALELCPPGHPLKFLALNNLGNCLSTRFKVRGKLADLEECIALLRQAVERCPGGHPLRSSALNNLGTCLSTRFKSQGVLADLTSAITCHQEALELLPVGHPDRPSSLNSLGTCLATKFKSQGTLADLEESVALHQAALELCPPGTSKWDRAARTLARSLEDRFKWLGSMSDIEEATRLQQSLTRVNGYHPLMPNGPLDIKQVIGDIIHDVLATIPPRLLNTHTGILCSRDAQISEFECSRQYTELLNSMASDASGYDWRPKLDHIRAVVAGYFQYVTLSHRWDNVEPLLQDIAGHGSVYAMSELGPPISLTKLQMFCRTAATRGYSWAWSDTCCIDKTNSVELQEAIGSMFLWYQRSALTIVYLADVPPSASPGLLSSSVWFKRGWTLQELLAPPTMLFYTKDWTLYLNRESTNHKKDPVVLQELERAASIASCYLTDFHPGMNDARLRLQWASGRRTTRPEDVAYSLFGIFDLHLPVLYGEAKEKALGRLLQEIISQSGNTSVLDWVGVASSFHSCFPTTITPYYRIPYAPTTLSNAALRRSISRLREFVSPDDALSLYRKLGNLPLPRFSNRRLVLPCIAHQVRAVKRRRTHLNNYVYEIKAKGLKPLEIMSPDELNEEPQTSLPYILIRIWDQMLLDCSEDEDEAAAYRLMAELEQPFSALMIEQVHHGREYKRILSSHLITGRVEDSASIANSDLMILDII